MITTRRIAYGTAAALLVVGLWFLRRHHDKKVDQAITSTVLKPEDSAKIIVDPRRHTITTVTRERGTNATYLPRTGAAVEIGKSGKITINSRPWGTEISPFVGGAFGTDIKLRAAAGLNLFYWYRWELGGGLLANNNVKDSRLFMHVSYNIYDNWYLSLGADNRGTAHIMGGLKF